MFKLAIRQFNTMSIKVFIVDPRFPSLQYHILTLLFEFILILQICIYLSMNRIDRSIITWEIDGLVEELNLLFSFGLSYRFFHKIIPYNLMHWIRWSHHSYLSDIRLLFLIHTWGGTDQIIVSLFTLVMYWLLSS